MSIQTKFCQVCGRFVDPKRYQKTYWTNVLIFTKPCLKPGSRSYFGIIKNSAPISAKGYSLLSGATYYAAIAISVTSPSYRIGVQSANNLIPMVLPPYHWCPPRVCAHRSEAAERGRKSPAEK